MMLLSSSINELVQQLLLDAGYDIGSPTPDGIMGKKSLLALNSPGVAEAVSAGVSAIVIPENESSNFVSKQELSDLISSAVSWFSKLSDRRVSALRSAIANERGNISLSGYLTFLVERENLFVNQGYKVDDLSPSGLHVGLTQMGQPAWIDASAISRDIPFVDMGDKEKFVSMASEPLLNLKAALAYCAMNFQYASVKVSKGVIPSFRPSYLSLYLLHNLGHGVINHLARERSVSSYSYFLSQSKKVRSEIKENEEAILADFGIVQSASLDYNGKIQDTSFTLADFTTKPRANNPGKSYLILPKNGRAGISETAVISNLAEVARVLDPIWRKHPGKFVINSGYRPGDGTSLSAHEIGSAVDITTFAPSNSIEGRANLKILADELLSGGFKFDQIISEAGHPVRDVWLHLGMKRQNGEQRMLTMSGLQSGSKFTKIHDYLVDWTNNSRIS